jgi:hypothetical protein
MEVQADRSFKRGGETEGSAGPEARGISELHEVLRFVWERAGEERTSEPLEIIAREAEGIKRNIPTKPYI